MGSQSYKDAFNEFTAKRQEPSSPVWLPGIPEAALKLRYHALPGERGRSGFDSTSRSVSRPHQWFTCIRLSNPHMT